MCSYLMNGRQQKNQVCTAVLHWYGARSNLLSIGIYQAYFTGPLYCGLGMLFRIIKIKYPYIGCGKFAFNYKAGFIKTGQSR